MLKIMRVFFGNYEANPATLTQYQVKVLRLPRPIITVLNSNQGFGRIEGITTESNNNQQIIFPNAQICLFKKITRQLLWETTSKANGSYLFRNVAVGLECFVIAFDPSQEYSAVIQDAVVAK